MNKIISSSQEMTYYLEKINDFKKSYYSNNKQIAMVIRMRNFIDNNYKENINLDLLARTRYVSKFHLLRLFKKYYGLTPRQYLIDKRIEKSKKFLESGKSVTRTCFSVGFESIGSFSKLFKKKTGKSPSYYLKK